MSNRQRDSRAARTGREYLHRVELLEPRKLLTTLMGGDVFEFIDVNGQTVRIGVDGNAIVELIGANTGGTGSLTLGDLPGDFINSETGRTTFNFLTDGTQLIGITNINTPSWVPADAERTNEINLAGLATQNVDGGDPTYGSTYAIDIGTYEISEGTEETYLQLVQLNNNTGTGTPVSQLMDPDGNPFSLDDSSVTAAAFRPMDGDAGAGRLYFVLTNADEHRLYSVDVSGGTPQNVVDEGIIADTDSVPTIGAMVWDQTSATESRLLFATVVTGSENDTGQLLIWDGHSVSAGNRLANLSSVDVEWGSGNAAISITTITGLAILDDDPTAANDEIFAVTAGDGSFTNRVLQVDVTNGQVVDFGNTVDPNADPDDENPLGSNLQGLTWNPNILNPYTGELGAMIATDPGGEGEPGSLVFVDWRFRSANQLFTIYVSQAEEGASLWASAVNYTEDGIALVPYDGVSELSNEGTNTIVSSSDPRFDLAVYSATEGKQIVVNFNDDIGGVYIGARQYVTREGSDELEPLLPVIDGLLEGGSGAMEPGRDSLGAYAFGVDLVDADPSTENVSAGAFLSAGLLDFFNTSVALVDRMIGSNVDDAVALAIQNQLSNSDSMVVIDNDNATSELVLINATTGKATDTHDLTHSEANHTVTQVYSADWRDQDLDGTETLYAIALVTDSTDPLNPTVEFGTIITNPTDPDFGLFTPDSGVTLGIPGGVTVLDMEFAPYISTITNEQALYVLGSNNHLYEINPNTGGVITDDELSAVTDSQFTSIAFSRNGQEIYAHDSYHACLWTFVKSQIGSGTLFGGDATEQGSVRPTVGGIAYDFENDRFLAVDNITARPDMGGGQAYEDESASIMVLRGVSSDTNQFQNFDNLFIGGKLTGRAQFYGNVDTVYAGVVLTGASSGQFLAEDPTVPFNFYVAGDLHNLVTASTIGSNTEITGLEIEYITGFDMYVGGELGTVRAYDSFIGGIGADNIIDDDEGWVGRAYYELEGRTTGDNPVQTTWLNYQLYDNSSKYYNDTFDTAQRLGSIRSGDSSIADYAQVQGTLFAIQGEDAVDYYSVSLMGGQSVEFQIEPLSSLEPDNLFAIGVFDAYGNLVATNYNRLGSNVLPDFINPDDLSRQDIVDLAADPFSFVAETPGEYRIAVALFEDYEFDDSATLVSELGIDYNLTVHALGTLGMGALVTDNTLVGHGYYFTANDSIGAITSITGSILTAHTHVGSGDLRSIQGASLSTSDTVSGLLTGDTILATPSGSIGLIRSTEGDIGIYTANRSVTNLNDHMANTALVGGDIQFIDAAGSFRGLVSVNGNIGTIRADEMNVQTTYAGTAIESVYQTTFFRVNADNDNVGGIIDLIDVAGQFGTLNGGGPGIVVGDNGNVRYMDLGGPVFQDQALQSGNYDSLTLSAGESYTHEDDGGGRMLLSPDSVLNPNFNPSQPISESNPKYLYQGTLTLDRYGIRSGGSVIFNIDVSELGLTAESLDAGAAVEIGTINFNTSGREVVVVNARTGQLGLNPDGDVNTDVDFIFFGSSIIDVFNIEGANLNVARILNNTGGEILNTNVGDIGEFYSKGLVGTGVQNTGAVVKPTDVITDAYPFQNQTSGIVAGDIVHVYSDTALGDFILSGDVWWIEADADHTNTTGQFEGYRGAVYTTGAIHNVHLGEGIIPAGTGNASQGGIYALGQIGDVIGSQTEIYGDIVSQTGIENVTITNGSLINAQIGVYASLDSARAFPLGQRILTGSIGEITITGSGGMVGTTITGGSIGDITVTGGAFGIFTSDIIGGNNGTVGDIKAAGYGLFNVHIVAPTELGNVVAIGDGQMLSVSDYDQSVRYSTVVPNIDYNPIFGQRLSILNDIDLAIHNDAGPGYEPRAGQIHRVLAQGNGDAGQFVAYRISDSSFNFSGDIQAVKTDAATSGDSNSATIDGLTVVAQQLNYFNPGGDVSGLDLSVSSTIRSLYLNADLLGGSSIRVTGQDGAIYNLVINGDLSGDVFANSRINKMFVRGDMDGNITVAGENVGNYRSLNYLKVDGDLIGSIDITGDVGTLMVLGTLGSSGDTLSIDGDMIRLSVGNYHSSSPDSLESDLVVTGDLRILDITGHIGGSIDIGGDVMRFTVQAHPDLTGINLLEDDVNIRGDLRVAQFRDGNLGNNLEFQVVGDIINFQVINGSVLSDFDIRTLQGDVNYFRILNGDLLGNLFATQGEIRRLFIFGSDLAGEVNAQSIYYMKLDGSILSGAEIHANKMNMLHVGEDVQANALLQVEDLNRLYVGQDLMGEIDLGSSSTLRVDVIDDWQVAENSTIDGDAYIYVRGDMTRATDGVLNVTGDTSRFLVNGDLQADVLLGGDASLIKIGGSIIDSVLTVAFDTQSLYVGDQILNSLIQVGISAGHDGEFAANTSDKDLGETSRIAELNRLTVRGDITDSIIAAGGSIGLLSTETMTNSSVSSGFSLGSAAIHEVMDTSPSTRLDTTTQRNDARDGEDRELFWGDITKAYINGDGLVNSYLTAGVDSKTDPGDPADFSNPTVLTSNTGGSSEIRFVSGTLGAGSRIVTDAGIRYDRTTDAGGSISQVNYTIGDITTDAGNPLQTNQGFAEHGQILTLSSGGATLEVRLYGPGQITAYDDDLSDGVIDAFVLTGTDSRTNIRMDGNFDIGRLLTEDDNTFRTLTMDGDFVGDGTSAPDLWIDGSVRSLSFDDLGDDVDARTGGDLAILSMDNQGAAEWNIGGQINRLNINQSTSMPALQKLGSYANSDYNVLSTDDSGNVWAHIGDGVLNRVDPENNNDILETITVADGYTGDMPNLLAMNFDGADLIAAARLYDPQATQSVGSWGSNTTLHALAINDDGEAYAIATVSDGGEDVDQLIRFDTETGEFTTIGTLTNFLLSDDPTYDQGVYTMAFDSSGRLLALVENRDGDTGSPSDGAALVQIQLTPDEDNRLAVNRIGNEMLRGTLLDGGGVTDAFTGMAISSSGTIYAIQRVGGTEDHLVTISASSGAISDLGAVQVDGGSAGLTQISGMGFDPDGNLVAFDNDGSTARTIYLASANLADPSAFAELTNGYPLDPDIDVYAINELGRSYAYDSAGSGELYTNPYDENDAQGRVAVLGTVDLTTGEFTRTVTASTENGAPAIVDTDENLLMMVDTSNDLIYLGVATETDGQMQLVSIDTTASNISDAISDIGVLQTSDGEAVDLQAFGNTIFSSSGGARLLAIDSDLRQFVFIDPSSGVISSATESSILPDTVTDFSIDSSTGEILMFLNSSEEPSENAFAHLRQNLGGITATSVGQLVLGEGTHYGRIVTTGNTFNRIISRGDFYGSLSTAGDIGVATFYGDEFGGVLSAENDINRVYINGGTSSNAQIIAGNEIGVLKQYNGVFSATVSADDINAIFTEDFNADAQLQVNELNRWVVNGSFFGEAEMDNINHQLRINDDFEGQLQVNHDANMVYINGDTGISSSALIGGEVNRLYINGTHWGTFATGGDATIVRVNNLSYSLLALGADVHSFVARGTVNDSVVSTGVWIGWDGVYNSSDDEIRGGELNVASFTGLFQDSVLAVSLLPLADAGPGLPSDHNVYIGEVQVGDHDTKTSGVNRLHFNDVWSSSDTSRSVVAVDGQIQKQTVRNGSFDLATVTTGVVSVSDNIDLTLHSFPGDFIDFL